MAEQDDKFKSYLTLFGLEEYFSDDELRSAYAALAKLNHPDINRDQSSIMRMVIVNEAYAFLREYAGRKPPEIGPKKRHDPAYEHYSTAFRLMKQAFNEYYGETEDKTNVGNSFILKERLEDAKNEFAFIVTDTPSSDWTSDAIDKIFSINKWLD